jgi:hypothetical protein
VTVGNESIHFPGDISFSRDFSEDFGHHTPEAADLCVDKKL